MEKSNFGEKEKEFTEEELKELDRTMDFGPAPAEAEATEKSIDEVIDRVRAKDTELRKGVQNVWEGIVGEPVGVGPLRSLGDGKFECTVTYGKGGRTKQKVVVQKPKEMFN